MAQRVFYQATVTARDQHGHNHIVERVPYSAELGADETFAMACAQIRKRLAFEDASLHLESIQIERKFETINHMYKETT